MKMKKSVAKAEKLWTAKMANNGINHQRGEMAAASMAAAAA